MASPHPVPVLLLQNHSFLYTFSWSYPCNIHFPSTLMFAHIISHIWFRVFTTTPPQHLYCELWSHIVSWLEWTQEFIALLRRHHIKWLLGDHTVLYSLISCLQLAYPPPPAPGCAGSTCLCSDSSASYLLLWTSFPLVFCPWRKIWAISHFSLLVLNVSPHSLPSMWICS